MKIILLTLFIGISTIQINQERPIDKWIQEIVEEMIEMNDLEKYSEKEIPSDIKVNFIMVESVKDIQIENGIISMLVNHGTGKYCTELKFKYVEKNKKFYLIFDEPERKFINPWIEKNKVCE
ncbi:hypothetical protein P8625_07140 [Tenacibaculum tangerinum]|uniref:Uncharacterized protein n=1 Tax=Tenacibaculum tangerinum TaxID=3038772 RepID=A0ABY8LA73_9FLAO|nr:hypothetical protein [Tenacibaculum tangerinum]WGH76910.1 hypothetical protein P8625_07140 [Tenacibaculum tangerinum]